MQGEAAPTTTSDAVECRVRIALAPPTALCVVAAIAEQTQRSYHHPYNHLRQLFEGTNEAGAVLTLCTSLHRARTAHPDMSVRLILRLADDAADSNLSVCFTFQPLGEVPDDAMVSTPPSRTSNAGEGSDSGGSGGGASSAGGQSSDGSDVGTPLGGGILRMPHTI